MRFQLSDKLAVCTTMCQRQQAPDVSWDRFNRRSVPTKTRFYTRACVSGYQREADFTAGCDLFTVSSPGEGLATARRLRDVHSDRTVDLCM